MKKRGLILALAVVVVLGMFFEGGLVSAGLFDWFGKITGKATSQGTNVSITISGTNAVTIEVFNSTLTGATVTPTEDTTVAITFVARVTDADGYLDINTTSVKANFTSSGEPVRLNNSCIDLSQNTTTAKNFSCTVSMWYFDKIAAWTITAAAVDLGNLTYVQNNTMVFNYAQLQALQMSPNSLTWASVSQSQTNKTSTNDPSLINNTGNYNFTNLSVTGRDLYNSPGTSYLGVGNFSVGNNTGSNAECDTSPAVNNATVLSNATLIQIKQTILSRGNHWVNDGSTGQEQLYYCLLSVPSNLPSGSYATTNSPSSAWTITGTL